jgi:DNA repair exonuclease SbcCD ATPase subunit
MKKITLQKMTLLNFKGIRKLEINFDGLNTEIHGDNGTGKTTIFDAFIWCLFGKDSSDRKDFEIKTLDENGNAISKLNHEVEIALLVDSDIVTLKRVYREKWTSKRGSNDAEFTGHETTFFWNDVPMLQNEYNKKVSEILDESIFKMITSPTFFNTSMKWQDRRDILLKITGEVCDTDIAGENPAYLQIISQLTQGKTLDQYKAQVKAQVSKLKEELKSIPTRIDEAERQRVTGIDFNALRAELAECKSQFDEVNGQLTNRGKAFESVLEQNKQKMISVSKLEAKLEAIKNTVHDVVVKRLTPNNSELSNLQKELQQKESELKSLEPNITFFKNQLASNEKAISDLNTQIQSKRDDYNTESEKEFTQELDNSCPTCKQPLPADQIEAKKSEMRDNFNKVKSEKLKQIADDGLKMKSTLQSTIEAKEKNESALNECTEKAGLIEKEVELLKEKIDTFNAGAKTDLSDEIEFASIVEAELQSNDEYIKTGLEIEAIKSEIKEVPKVDNSELEAKQKAINSRIDEINAELAKESVNASIDSRVKELQAQEKDYVEKINDVDRILFNVENFEKEKITRSEELVNSKFSLVKFKMFKEQINGGYEPTCVATVNGVPFNDANTASKINAGLDIINTLSQFYGVFAPIFVDNRESIVRLIDSESQIISLVVDPEFNQLKVV